MALIKEGVWCVCHGLDIESIRSGNFSCDAHMIEARIFDCPYKNLEDRNENPCADYEILLDCPEKRKYDRISKIYSQITIKEFLRTGPKDFEDGGKYAD